MPNAPPDQRGRGSQQRQLDDIRRAVAGEAARKAPTAPGPRPPVVAAPAATCQARPTPATTRATAVKARSGARQLRWVPVGADGQGGGDDPDQQQHPGPSPASGRPPAKGWEAAGAGLVTAPEPVPMAKAREPASTWPSSADTIRQPARYDPWARAGRVAASTSGCPSAEIRRNLATVLRDQGDLGQAP